MVVGSGRLGVAGDPSTVTGPGARCAPSRVRTGPFGQSRKTRWSVGRSGVNTTLRVPVARCSAGWIAALRV
jgi:hypothetical protein